MKLKTIGFRMEAKPEAQAAELYIFDDIGESEDWDGVLHGFGPKGLVEQLNAITAPAINVHINSLGGYVYDGIAVKNLLQNCGKTINVIVEGIAASAASVIAMAGDTITMRPEAQLMLHNCWTFAIGNSAELRKVADDMDALMAGMRKAYLAKAAGKLSEEKLIELLDAETYLSAQESYKLGLCDAITGEDPDENEDTNGSVDADPRDKTETKPKANANPFWFVPERR